MIRNTTLSLVLVATAASLAGAQEWADKMFKVRTHDFGTVARGSQAVFEFEVQNIYKEPIHIAGVRTSCGCTTPSIKNESLNTWEKGAIVTKFNTASFLGKRGATITVTIDKPYRAEVQLNVTGYIRSDVVFSPGVVEFGEVEGGEVREKKVQVEYAGRTDWQITDVRSANEDLEVELNPTRRANGRVGYELTVRLKEGAPAGFFNDQLYLITNDRRSNIPLAVSGKVTPSITVSPASLFLGVLPAGQTVTKQLIVRGKKPFRITNIPL